MTMMHPTSTRDFIHDVSHSDAFHVDVDDEYFKEAIRSILALYAKGVITEEQRESLLEEILTSLIQRKLDQVAEGLTDAVLSISGEPHISPRASGIPQYHRWGPAAYLSTPRS